MLSVSVALATCNGEEFLARQLRSIADQTEPPDELVVCDDVSTDGTLRVLADFARGSAFPVRVHVNERRLGYRANFMNAAARCDSDLIFFCDQDDVWLAHKVASVRAAFSDPETLLAYHNAAVVDRGEVRSTSLTDAATENEKLSRRPMHPWHFSLGLVQAFRSSLRAFDDLWPHSRDHVFDGDQRLAHDQWYFFLALAFGKARFIDDELLLYRQHGANTFGAGKRRGAWRKLLDRFPHGADADVRGMAAAQRRAEILRIAASRLPPEKRERVVDLAVRYDELADRLGRRHATYTRASLPARAAALRASYRADDYRGNPWAFDWRSIPRDIVAGVIQGGVER